MQLSNFVNVGQKLKMAIKIWFKHLNCEAKDANKDVYHRILRTNYFLGKAKQL